jgi:hypothetical protein
MIKKIGADSAKIVHWESLHMQERLANSQSSVCTNRIELNAQSSARLEKIG